MKKCSCNQSQEAYRGAAEAEGGPTASVVLFVVADDLLDASNQRPLAHGDGSLKLITRDSKLIGDQHPTALWLCVVANALRTDVNGDGQELEMVALTLRM